MGVVACSMPIDRTDRVAIQLGRDTKTVGVRNCYLNYAISKCSLGDGRDITTPLQDNKKDDEGEEEARNSIRRCTEIQMSDGRCMADMHLLGDTCKPQLKGAPNLACFFMFLFSFL
jgi:hypothetical protein